MKDEIHAPAVLPVGTLQMRGSANQSQQREQTIKSRLVKAELPL